MFRAWISSAAEFYLIQIKFTVRCARILQSRTDAATSSKESSDLGMAIINLFDSNNLSWASLKYGTPNYLIYNKLHLLLKQIARFSLIIRRLISNEFNIRYMKAYFAVGHFKISNVSKHAIDLEYSIQKLLFVNRFQFII